MKKIIVAVLCAALLSTSFPISVFAETAGGNENPEAGYTENFESRESRTFEDQETGIKVTVNDDLPEGAELEVSKVDKHDDNYESLKTDLNTSKFVAYNVKIEYEDNEGKKHYDGNNWNMAITIPDELAGKNIIDVYCMDEDRPFYKSGVYAKIEGNCLIIKSQETNMGTQIALVDPVYLDLFRKITTDGTLEVNSIKPDNEEELNILMNDVIGFIRESEEYHVSCKTDPDNFDPENVNITIESHYNWDYSDSHQVRITYYEPEGNLIKEAEELAQKFRNYIGDGSEERLKEKFALEDLPLLNYRIHSGNDFFDIKDATETSVALEYVPEVHEAVKNSDLFIKYAESYGAGEGDVGFNMYIMKVGAFIIYNDGIPCYISNPSGIWFEGCNKLYIPDDAENPEAAAKERLDAYLGKGKYTLEDVGTLESFKIQINAGEVSLEEWCEDNPAYDLNSIAGDSYYKLTLTATGKTYNYVLYKMPEEYIKTPEADYTDETSEITVIGENAVLPIDVVLSVKKIENDEDISDSIGIDNYAAYDISLHSATYGGEIKSIKNGPVTVKLPIPESLQNKDIAVYHISDNDVETEIRNVKVEDGYAIFKTDNFSTYVVAEKTKGGDDKPSDPGENNPDGNSGGSGGSTTPSTPSVTKDRVAGDDRFQTAINVANQLKSELGVVKFNNIVVANSDEFADALSATALAADKNAPILVVNKNNESIVKTYIANNLNKGGNVYIIGGTAVVSEGFEKSLTDCKVTRLGGSDRYETNLEVLKELKVTGASDIMVASGLKYPDALSASATGNPVLLVGKTLTDNQKAYLATLGGNDDYYVIGETAAVNADVAKAVDAYGTVTRLGGDTRYETGLAVAEEFFTNARTVVIASGDDFPDGLTGGVLANAMNAPLMLVNQYNTTVAADYVDDNNVRTVIAIGGTTVIPDATLNKVA